MYVCVCLCVCVCVCVHECIDVGNEVHSMALPPTLLSLCTRVWAVMHNMCTFVCTHTCKCTICVRLYACTLCVSVLKCWRKGARVCVCVCVCVCLCGVIYTDNPQHICKIYFNDQTHTCTHTHVHTHTHMHTHPDLHYCHCLCVQSSSTIKNNNYKQCIE